MNELDRLSIRVKARKAAEEMAQMINEEIESDSPLWQEVYRRTIIDSISRVSEIELRETLEPMGEEEARRFEETTMPFGKDTGAKIKDIRLDYLDYIARDDHADFIKNLKRYLLSDRVRREREK